MQKLYEPINPVLRKVAEIDQAGVRTEFMYDEAGNLTGVNDAMGGETRYSYDPGGNLLTITDPNNHTTSFTYDELGRKTSRTLPEGMAETWQYQDCCNASSHTDFNGATISYEYDLMKREIKRTYPDGKKIERQYNARGQVKRVVYTGYQFSGGEAYSDRVFTYDPTTGKLIRDDKEDGQYIAYSYDVAGNLIETSYSGGHAVHYTHDALNRLKTVTDEHGTTEYTYDKVGNRKSMTYPNDTSATYKYDNLNRLTYLENKGPNGVISSYDYTLGPAGNRRKIVEHNGDVCEYEYDKLYRLTRESRTGDHAYWIEYTYDAFGNRLEMNTGGAVTSYTYDKNDRLQSESGPNGITSYTWDANGNMTGKDGPTDDWTYAWNYDNKMIEAQKNAQFEASYSYDFRGERISKATSTDETAFLIDNNNQTGYSQALREVDSNNEEQVAYTFGDDLISQSRQAVAFLHYDGLGSTRALTSAAATTTDTFAYLAFGSILNKTGDTLLTHLFTGEAYDFNLRYYYLRSRNYSPIVASFISKDDFGGIKTHVLSRNKYIYALMNPVNYKDYSGNTSLIEVMVVVSIIGILAVMGCSKNKNVLKDYNKIAADTINKSAIYNARANKYISKQLLMNIITAETKRKGLYRSLGEITGLASSYGPFQLRKAAHDDVMKHYSNLISKYGNKKHADLGSLPGSWKKRVKHEGWSPIFASAYLAKMIADRSKPGRSLEDSIKYGIASYVAGVQVLINWQNKISPGNPGAVVDWKPLEEAMSKSGDSSVADIPAYVNEVYIKP